MQVAIHIGKSEDGAAVSADEQDGELQHVPGTTEEQNNGNSGPRPLFYPQTVETPRSAGNSPKTSTRVSYNLFFSHLQ